MSHQTFITRSEGHGPTLGEAKIFETQFILRPLLHKSAVVIFRQQFKMFDPNNCTLSSVLFFPNCNAHKKRSCVSSSTLVSITSWVKNRKINYKIKLLPSFLGANNNFAKVCKHNGRTKTFEFCHKLDSEKKNTLVRDALAIQHKNSRRKNVQFLG